HAPLSPVAGSHILPFFPYTALFRSYPRDATDHRSCPRFVRRVVSRRPDERAPDTELCRASTVSRSWIAVDAGFICPVSGARSSRSEERTFELQSLTNLVCRLLLDKH